MRLCILCTNPEHPVVPRLRQWQAVMTAQGHQVSLYFDKQKLEGGDMLFLVSCSQIIGHNDRKTFGAVLVLHASNLPMGRGWSPHIWAVVNHARQITVCLLEAQDPVDSGDVWLKEEFVLEGHELLPEINEKLFAAELALMTRAVTGRDQITPIAQTGDPGPYLERRTPEHSRLDPQRSLAEQFDLLRVVDNTRYPAFMDHRGKRYRLKIEKIDDDR